MTGHLKCMAYKWCKGGTENTKLLQSSNRWRKQSLPVVFGGKWHFDGVSNESTTCQRVTRGQFKCRRSLALPLALSILFLPFCLSDKSLVSPSCSFLSFCALFESICMPWPIFCFLLHHVACSAAPPFPLFSTFYLMFSFLPPPFAWWAAAKHRHCVSRNYFLHDHPHSRSALLQFLIAYSLRILPILLLLLLPLSRRFSLPLANCVNQFDQLTDSQRAPLWQTLIAPRQQRLWQPPLGLWLQLIGTVALATHPPTVPLTNSLPLSLSLFLFFSLTRFGSQLLFGLYRFAFQLQILQFMPRATRPVFLRPQISGLNAIYNISTAFGFRFVQQQQPQLSEEKCAPCELRPIYNARFEGLRRENCRPTGWTWTGRPGEWCPDSFSIHRSRQEAEPQKGVSQVRCQRSCSMNNWIRCRWRYNYIST